MKYTATRQSKKLEQADLRNWQIVIKESGTGPSNSTGTMWSKTGVQGDQRDFKFNHLLYLFDWCFMPYLRMLHFYNRKPGSPQGKPMTITISGRLSPHRKGSRHDLSLNSQQQH